MMFIFSGILQIVSNSSCPNTFKYSVKRGCILALILTFNVNLQCLAFISI